MFELDRVKSPYPYTQFGYRCASSVYRNLKKFRAIKSIGPMNNFTNAFGPGFLYRYLRRKGFEKSTFENFNRIEKHKDSFNRYGEK